MRLFLLLILAITVTAISTSALAKDRWEGYRTLDSKEVQDLNLPFMEFAKNAVFEMETVGVTASPGEQFEVIPDVSKEPVVTDPNILSKNIRLMQIETCRKQGLTACPVLGYSNKGTAFFNRGRFVTCRHGFHNWISLASQLNGDISVKEISPPMILRNSEGEVVYNSALSGKPQMEFSAINDDARINYQTHKLNYPTKGIAVPAYYSDYTEMTLAEQIVDPKLRSLSEHIPSNSSSFPTNETYLLGYSEKTNNFPKGVGDSPENGAFVISNGHIENRESSYYKATNYSTGGMSGGPLITAKGELLGVNCKSTTESDKTKSPPLSPSESRSFSFPLGKNFAENYWRSLSYASDQELASVQIPELTSVVSQ